MRDRNSTDNNIRFRAFKDKLFRALVVVLSFMVMIPLILIIYYIMKNGFSVINWEFLTTLPKPIGDAGGGIANAITGTVMLVAIAAFLAVPLGISAGIYLSENRNEKVCACVRMCMDILQGIPSIVIGIIAYSWVVVSMGSFSAFSGGVALAIMMFPVIVRSTEETLKLIPESLKEASLALGVPYSITILKVIVPAGITGIITGTLLGIARIAGETAPLLFTAFGSPYMNVNVFKPVDSLPLMIFNYATSPYPQWQSMAWGASFILVVLVLGLNLITKVMTKRLTIRF